MSTPGRPNLSPTQAQDAAHGLFGVRASAKELPSDSDRNFRLTCDGEPSLLLKVANTQTRPQILDLQNDVLRTLAASDMAPLIPKLLPTTTGAIMGQITDSEGHPCLTRLLTYLSGRPIAEIEPSEALLSELGMILGQTNKILAEFRHDEAGRYLKWDSQHATAVIAKHIDYATDDRRAVIGALAATSAQSLDRHRGSLRKSLIHNDANDYNILVDGDGPAPRISGLIDFGDIVHSYTVAELANCAAYMMLDKPDPIATAATIARGYESTNPLNEAEKQALFDLIVTRLCLSASIGARQTRQDPNNAYLAISQRPVSDLLTRLYGEDYHQNTQRLRQLTQ